MTRIVALVAARKNSKYLAHFLHSYLARTEDPRLVCVCNAEDEWNGDVIDYFTEFEGKFIFYLENYGYGRAGLHLYYQNALQRAQSQDVDWEADWFVYFCEDHEIILYHWDKVLAGILSKYDADKPYIGVPGWDNTGSVNHVLSRGYIEALGGRLASHGNLDSYINDIAARLPRSHVIRLPVLFHDFTADHPCMLDDCRTKVELSEAGQKLPLAWTEETKANVERDAEIVKAAIRKGVTR